MNEKVVYKAYKVRLYPNKQQELVMKRTLDACRFVWNFFLEQIEQEYHSGNKKSGYATRSRQLTKMAKTVPELQGVQSVPVQQSLRRLELAYSHFFKRIVSHPSPKKKEIESFSFQKNKDWRVEANKIHIQRNLVVKARGRMPEKAVKQRALIVKFKAGKWYAFMIVQESATSKLPTREPVGVDVGLKHLAVTSRGDKFDSAKPGYEGASRLRTLTRKMNRQVFGSKRRENTRREIAKLHQKISFIRLDHIHKVSHSILSENPSVVAIEDLNVKGMMGNRRLSRAIGEASFSELHRQLKYKQEWRGGKVIEVNRFYPSTKTCSNCFTIKEDITLSDRVWTCAGCGVTHDRDINASRNILRQGMASVEGKIEPTSVGVDEPIETHTASGRYQRTSN